MPNLIPHIDKIGREKQRDVLTLEFHDNRTALYQPYQINESRQIIIAWLNENDISYCMCGPYASETKIEAYRGQIYIDVPYDEANPLYVKLANFLEGSDTSCRFAGIFFRCYSLGYCMKNAHHDLPSSWENFAESF